MTTITPAAHLQTAASAPDNEKPEAKFALPVDNIGLRAAGALTGAASWGLQATLYAGAAKATTRLAAAHAPFAATPIAKIAPFATRNRTIAMMAGVGAIMGWRGADKIAEKLGKLKAFTEAEHKDLRRSMVEGPLMGAAVLGGGIGVVGVGARAVFASRMMGHEKLATTARFAAKHVGRWAAVGAATGVVLGAATGAMQSDPSQTWGSIAETAFDLKSARTSYGIFGGIMGGLLGVSAFMASKKPGAGVKAALKGAAVFGSVAYMGGAAYRMTTTGIHAAGAANKRWDNPATSGS